MYTVHPQAIRLIYAVSRVSETKQENRVDICTENKTTLVCVHICTYIHLHVYVYIVQMRSQCDRVGAWVCEQRIDIIISGAVYRPFLILSPREGRCVRTRKPRKGFTGHWTMAKSRLTAVQRNRAAVEQKRESNAAAHSPLSPYTYTYYIYHSLRGPHIYTAIYPPDDPTVILQSVLISFWVSLRLSGACNVRWPF